MKIQILSSIALVTTLLSPSAFSQQTAASIERNAQGKAAQVVTSLEEALSTLSHASWGEKCRLLGRIEEKKITLARSSLFHFEHFAKKSTHFSKNAKEVVLKMNALTQLLNELVEKTCGVQMSTEDENTIRENYKSVLDAAKDLKRSLDDYLFERY